MELIGWIVGALICLYLIVGVFVFFRRSRRGGTLHLPPAYAEGGALLAVIALWPLYARAGAGSPPEPGDSCVSCGASIPAQLDKCPACGWTWKGNYHQA